MVARLIDLRVTLSMQKQMLLIVVTQSRLYSLLLQVHLGVNSGALGFAIERLAVNEATFAGPDELGWQPWVSLLLLWLIGGSDFFALFIS